jgi:hypothetical protein
LFMHMKFESLRNLSPNAKDLIRSAAECNPWNEPVPGEGRRADKSRVDGTAALLTAGAMGIQARRRRGDTGEGEDEAVATAGRRHGKGRCQGGGRRGTAPDSRGRSRRQRAVGRRGQAVHSGSCRTGSTTGKPQGSWGVWSWRASVGGGQDGQDPEGITPADGTASGRRRLRAGGRRRWTGGGQKSCRSDCG